MADRREPSAAVALSFGVVALAIFAVVCLVSAWFVATPRSTTTVGSSPPAASVDTTFAVSLQEFSIGPSTTTLSPGVKTAQITNSGTIPHELLIFRSDLAPSAYPIDPATGDINEDGSGITKISDGDNLDAGATQTRAVDLSQPGTYTLICNLHGHFRAGMVKTITVAPQHTAAAITLTDFRVGSGTPVFNAGTYDFSIANGGPSQHELLVFQTNLAPADFPRNSDGSVQENGPGLNKISDGDNIDPGKIQARTVDLTHPGSYVLICNLPGHFAAGMYATINVPG